MNTTKKTPAFLAKIPHEYLIMSVVYDDAKQKDVKQVDGGVGKGWTQLEAEYKCASNQFVTCFYNLKGTNYAVVDIDEETFNPETDLDALFDQTDIDSLWVPGNTKGCHIWMEFEPGQKPSQKNHEKCMKMYEGDYLGEKVFERVGKKWDFDDKIMPGPQIMTAEMMSKTYTEEVIQKMKQEGAPKRKRDVVEDAPLDNQELNQLAVLCDMIHIQHLDKRESWMQIVLALKKINPPRAEDIARLLSQKSASYTDEGFDGLWESYEPDQISCGMGTIKHYAKLSNEAQYKALTARPKFDPAILVEAVKRGEAELDASMNRIQEERAAKFNPEVQEALKDLLQNHTENALARVFVALRGDDMLFQSATDKVDEKMYHYYHGQWREDPKPNLLTKQLITTALGQFFVNQIKETTEAWAQAEAKGNATEGQVLKKQLNNLVECHGYTGKTQWKNNITAEIKSILAGSLKKVEFDMKSYLFSFNNQCFDLRTNQEHTPSKYDYILLRTGTDYVKPTPEQVARVGALVEQVLPDPEARRGYMSVLRAGMVGQTLEKFTMANGCGRNGKTFLHELFMAALGEYAIKGNVSIITDKMKSGPNPELANLDKKRFVLWAEPEEHLSLATGTIKDLTGGDTITAKQCHSNKTEQVNHATHVMECNQRPGFDGKINLALVERFQDYLFPSYFSTDPNEYNDPEFNDGHCYKRDDALKEKDFKEEHRCALFHYIMEYEGAEALYTPECVKLRTRVYLDAKDEMSSWFNSLYEIAWKDEGDTTKGRDMTRVIKLGDAYNNFKEGDVYMNMSKKEKRKMTRATFIEAFQTHLNFKHYYKERDQSRGANNRHVLRGFKEKVGDLDLDE